jgi:acylphosphatase
VTVVRFRALVSGRVQGVWFRDSCRNEARRLGVSGWVRNRYDGRVELEAQGEEDAVARLLAWCRIGPTLAEVTGVELTQIDPEGLDPTAPGPFSIRP